jgi:hypothetical protein
VSSLVVPAPAIHSITSFESLTHSHYVLSSHHTRIYTQSLRSPTLSARRPRHAQRRMVQWRHATQHGPACLQHAAHHTPGSGQLFQVLALSFGQQQAKAITRARQGRVVCQGQYAIGPAEYHQETSGSGHDDGWSFCTSCSMMMILRLGLRKTRPVVSRRVAARALGWLQLCFERSHMLPDHCNIVNLFL